MVNEVKNYKSLINTLLVKLFQVQEHFSSNIQLTLKTGCLGTCTLGENHSE